MMAYPCDIDEADLAEQIDLARYRRVLDGPERCYWLGVLAARAGIVAGNSPPPSPNPFKRAPAGKVGIGLIQPGMWSGGAERYHLQVWQTIDQSRFYVVGTVVPSDSSLSPLHAGYEAAGPVEVGIQAARHLARTVDVLLAWGMPDLDKFLPPSIAPARLVLLSHGRCDWTASASSHATRSDCKAVAIASEDCRHTVPAGYSGPVYVAWSMADPERIRPRISRAEQRRLWGVPEGFKVALHVARPSPEKRCHLAYRGLPPGWAYVCIGTAPNQDSIIEDARRTANGPAIFAGFMGDIGSALGAADCMVLPSDNEGCSLAAIEAHAASVPLIATPIGLYAAHPELARLIPLDATPEDVGRAMLAAIDDRQGTAARAEAALSHVAEHHSPAAFGGRWNAILDSVSPARHPDYRPFDAEILRRWNACPHRKSGESCGCIRCEGGTHHDQVVRYHQCFDCLKESAADA